jgi:hypothetical protein
MVTRVFKVSDIDTRAVDSLKVLDPDGRLEKQTSGPPAYSITSSARINARTCAPNRAWHGRSGRDRDPLR